MTKKDYVLLASAVRSQVTRSAGDLYLSQAVRDVAAQLAIVLERDNPNFRSATFMKACGL